MKKVFVLSILLSSLTIVTYSSNDNSENTNSKLFKMSRNSNRVALFESLKNQLKTKNNLTGNSSVSTYNDVISLFGDPTLKIQQKLIYTLNPSNGCKAIFEFDGFKNLTYVGLVDCN